MPFDWKEDLEVGRFLEQHAATSGSQEAFVRSAVSRAYYAAFCHVRNYARDKLGFRPRNDADDHGRLHARLKQGKLRGVAVKLERLREWRLRRPTPFRSRADPDLSFRPVQQRPV